MAVKVKIPTMLLKLTGNKNEVSVGGKSVRGMIDQLDKKYPGMRDLLLTPDGGAINHHFLICINEEDVRYLDQLDTPLSPGDRIEIVASIAGGETVNSNP